MQQILNDHKFFDTPSIEVKSMSPPLVHVNYMTVLISRIQWKTPVPVSGPGPRG